MQYISKHGSPYAVTHRKGGSGITVTAVFQWPCGRLVTLLKCKLYSENPNLNSTATVQRQGQSKESIGKGEPPLEGHRYTLVYYVPVGGATLSEESVTSIIDALDQIGMDVGFDAMLPSAEESIRGMLKAVEVKVAKEATKLPPKNSYLTFKEWFDFAKAGPAKEKGDPQLPPEIASLFKPKE